MSRRQVRSRRSAHRGAIRCRRAARRARPKRVHLSNRRSENLWRKRRPRRPHRPILSGFGPSEKPGRFTALTRAPRRPHAAPTRPFPFGTKPAAMAGFVVPTRPAFALARNGVRPHIKRRHALARAVRLGYTSPRRAPTGRRPRPSSSGLGRRPFTAKTGVRVPLGAPSLSHVRKALPPPPHGCAAGSAASIRRNCGRLSPR